MTGSLYFTPCNALIIRMIQRMMTRIQKIQLIQTKKYSADPYPNTPKNPPKIHARIVKGRNTRIDCIAWKLIKFALWILLIFVIIILGIIGLDFLIGLFSRIGL